MASDSSEAPQQGIAGAVATPNAAPAPAPPARPMLKLYSFWRSSCSQLVRIALNLKGLEYDYKPVNLLANEQSDPEFEKLNPIKYVSALVDGDTIVAYSFAILLIASIVGSSIQLLQNYPVFSFIEDKFDFQETTKWTQHHINRGFTALEKLLKGCTTKYATGDEVQLGDIFLEPHIYGGIKRFGIDMSNSPTLARLHETYMEHSAFQAELPEKQPDAPSS